jgi:outer membrane immunogenic protein
MSTDTDLFGNELLALHRVVINSAAMKKTMLTFTTLFAVSALIYGGPEPLPSGKEMKEVAPAPPPCPNWSGFYVGISGGYKFASANQTLELNGAWDTNSTRERDPVEIKGSGELDTTGGELGGVIGYNFQWNNWVLGLEAAGGYLWLRDSSAINFDVLGTTPTYEVDAGFRTRYLFTFAPRFGYAFCRWMPYVTGGLAVGDVFYEQEIINQTLAPHFFEGGNTDDTRAGWMVGGGLEYALTDHWHLRAQYQYIDLGTASFDSSSDLGGLTYTGHHELEVHEHNASFAIMYKF